MTTPTPEQKAQARRDQRTKQERDRYHARKAAHRLEVAGRLLEKAAERAKGTDAVRR